MINEVPQDFPAVLLWKFRVASLGTQLVLWTSLSAGFGYMVQRRLTQGGR
jgi:predicted cobalt transporter CbtA